MQSYSQPSLVKNLRASCLRAKNKGRTCLPHPSPTRHGFSGVLGTSKRSVAVELPTPAAQTIPQQHGGAPYLLSRPPLPTSPTWMDPTDSGPQCSDGEQLYQTISLRLESLLDIFSEIKYTNFLGMVILPRNFRPSLHPKLVTEERRKKARTQHLMSSPPFRSFHPCRETPAPASWAKPWPQRK